MIYGKREIMTWAALTKYANNANAGVLYTVLSRDTIKRATEKAPNGFNFATLQTDLSQLNTVPPLPEYTEDPITTS